MDIRKQHKTVNEKMLVKEKVSLFGYRWIWIEKYDSSRPEGSSLGIRTVEGIDPSMCF